MNAIPRDPDPQMLEQQRLLAECCLLRIENAQLKDQNLLLRHRLRAANTARVMLRQRLRKLL